MWSRQMTKVIKIPKYTELPAGGYYLDQAVQYVNSILVSAGVEEITFHMVKNYIKIGIVPSPEEKLYYREHIASILFVAVAKMILPLERMTVLKKIEEAKEQKETWYNYFATEFENGLEHKIKEHSIQDDKEKFISDLICAVIRKMELLQYIEEIE